MCMRASRLKYRYLGSGLAVVFGLSALITVEAQDTVLDNATASIVQPSSSGVDLVKASAIAQQAHGGEVIKAELTRYQGGRVYMVRLLDDGRVRDVLIDAASGILVEPEWPEQVE